MLGPSPAAAGAAAVGDNTTGGQVWGCTKLMVCRACGVMVAGACLVVDMWHSLLWQAGRVCAAKAGQPALSSMQQWGQQRGTQEQQPGSGARAPSHTALRSKGWPDRRVSHQGHRSVPLMAATAPARLLSVPA